MTHLLILRHGESEGNRAGRFSPTEHIALTPRGRRQALQMAETIKREYAVSRILSSPHKRAIETAAIVAQALGRPGDYETSVDLRERSVGTLAGMPYGTMKGDPMYDASQFWEWRPSAGESLEDVRVRAGRLLETLVAANPTTDLLLITHAGVMASAHAYVTGEWSRTGIATNCELWSIPCQAQRLSPCIRRIPCSIQSLRTLSYEEAIG